MNPLSFKIQQITNIITHINKTVSKQYLSNFHIEITSSSSLSMQNRLSMNFAS